LLQLPTGLCGVAEVELSLLQLLGEPVALQVSISLRGIEFIYQFLIAGESNMARNT
jgi:hypothetical protein